LIVRELELRYAVTLPADFKDYLLNSCPAEDACDVETTTWWAVGSMKTVPEDYSFNVNHPAIALHANKCLLFADYCIWCWAWAITCTDDEDRGKVALIGGAPDRFVADSFSDFVQRYIGDVRSVC